MFKNAIVWRFRLKNIKISVVVPIYNVEKFLKQCVESILDQEYKNVEIVLVDDGSTDASGEICDSFASNDERVKVVHKRNGGLVSARKAGVDKSTGHYITFVDGDDWVDNRWLSEVAKIINDYEPDIVEYDAFKSLNGKNIELPVSSFNGIYDREKIEKYIIPFMLHDGREKFYKFGVLPAVWSKVIKSNILKQNMCSDDKITFGEDVACIYNCLLDCKTFYGLRKNLYFYRQNNQSMTKAYDSNRFERIRVLFRYLEKKLLPKNMNICSQYNNYKMFCILYAILNEAKASKKVKCIANDMKLGLESIGETEFVRKYSIKKGRLPWNIMVILLKRNSYFLLAIFCRMIVSVKYNFKE